MIDLDELLKVFRIASRELFNLYFRVVDPFENNDSWDLVDRFAEVQQVLYQNLVLCPAALSRIPYGQVHDEIAVVPRPESRILLNREIDSGYWDHPVSRVGEQQTLLFIEFFDWNSLEVRDNQYVRVKVVQWADHPELIGKHALVEARYVAFRRTGSEAVGIGDD